MLDLRHLHLMLWPWKVLSLSLQRQLTKGQRRSKQRRCATFFNSCLQLSCIPTLQHLLCCFSQRYNKVPMTQHHSTPGLQITC